MDSVSKRARMETMNQSRGIEFSVSRFMVYNYAFCEGARRDQRMLVE